jgi:hypothetical protein
MKIRTTGRRGFLRATAGAAAACFAAPYVWTASRTGAKPARRAGFPTFEYHEIGKIGNLMGQTSLVDIDKDGRLDWVVGCSHGDVWWFQYKGPDNWVRHKIGSGVGTEVGGVAIDGDGWIDQVSGSTWFRNPGNPAGKEFVKYSNGAM